MREQFLDDLSAQSLEPALSHLRVALLVMHAPNNLTVGVDHAARIFAAAKHPKSFVSLDKADLLVSKAEDAEHVAEPIAGEMCSRGAYAWKVISPMNRARPCCALRTNVRCTRHCMGTPWCRPGWSQRQACEARNPVRSTDGRSGSQTLCEGTGAVSENSKSHSFGPHAC